MATETEGNLSILVEGPRIPEKPTDKWSTLINPAMKGIIGIKKKAGLLR
jgi:hypothetical protein